MFEQEQAVIDFVAAQVAVNEFLTRRQQKRQMWEELRNEASRVVGEGFAAMSQQAE